ncbi:MAG TPA: signal peptidase I [Candidatus Nanoarchaeia archaeon]|nr:signal peptidase I [Candidatus Nanoarchaeia archaeon]
MNNYLKKLWDIFWKDDSILGWILNIIVAIILVKFVIYPGLGFVFNTDFPVVAVISGSMVHERGFDKWWVENGNYYEQINISKEQFKDFRFKNGFNRGDIMVLWGRSEINIGDVIVFQGTANKPIIHRVIERNGDGTYRTKGDHNSDSRSDELKVSKVYGEAVFRIPLLGYIKIFFTDILNLIFGFSM